VFAILCAGAVAVLAVNLLTPRGDAHTAPSRDEAETVPLLLRVRAVSVTGVWALAVYGVYTFLGEGLRQTGRFSGGLVALSLVAYGLGALVGNLSSGPLADRFGGLAVTTTSLAALAIVEAVLGLVVRQRVGVLIGLVAFALAAYPYFSAHQTRLLARYGSHAASLMAWNNTAMYIGILIASAFGGTILAKTGFRTLIEISAAIALGGALATQVVIPAESNASDLAQARQ
jgi:predicted MFS family arabinose efflux permease